MRGNELKSQYGLRFTDLALQVLHCYHLFDENSLRPASSARHDTGEKCSFLPTHMREDLCLDFGPLRTDEKAQEL
jgi:hypothetical protein